MNYKKEIQDKLIEMDTLVDELDSYLQKEGVSGFIYDNSMSQIENARITILVALDKLEDELLLTRENPDAIRIPF